MIHQKYSTFLNNRFINTVLKVTKAQLIDNIVCEINGNGGKFGVSMDCSTDTSFKHQTSISVRYINNECGISEATVAFKEESNTTGEGLFRLLDASLKEIGLKTENIIGFSFDGAANMRSESVGVVHFIHQKNPHAIYIWCFAHRLNLVVKRTCNSIRIKFLLETVEEAASFFRASYKRMQIWTSTAQSVPEYNSQTKLKLIGQTRWTSKEDAVNNVMKSELHLFVVIKALIRMCNSDGVDGKALLTACNLLNVFSDYAYIMSLFLLRKAFIELLPVTKYLQSYGLCIIDAKNSVKTLIDTLDDVNENIIETHLEEAEAFIENVNALILKDEYIGGTDSAFKIKIPTNENKERADTDTKNTMKLLYKSLIEELKSTFTGELEDEGIYKEISHLDIGNPEVWFQHTDDICLERLCHLIGVGGENSAVIEELKLFVREFHQNQISASVSLLNIEELDEGDDYLPAAVIDLEDTEYDIEQPRIPDQARIHRCYCIECILKFIKNSEAGLGKYGNVYKLYKLLAVIPSTQVKCERDFSKMKFAKNRLRTSLVQDNFQNLMILSTEAAMCKNINLDQIIDQVALTSRSLSEKLL